jgi:hypothetical protein
VIGLEASRQLRGHVPQLAMIFQVVDPSVG